MANDIPYRVALMTEVVVLGSMALGMMLGQGLAAGGEEPSYVASRAVELVMVDGRVPVAPPAGVDDGPSCLC